MVSNMVQYSYMVLFELIYNGHPDIIHRDRSHHYLGQARLESLLPDNFDALNACFRDTVITILLVQRELSGDRWIHGTVGIKKKCLCDPSLFQEVAAARFVFCNQW